MDLGQESGPASRFAILIAAGRAVGAREPDAGARNPDYLAEQLLQDPSILNRPIRTVRALSIGYEEAMSDFGVCADLPCPALKLWVKLRSMIGAGHGAAVVAVAHAEPRASMRTMVANGRDLAGLAAEEADVLADYLDDHLGATALIDRLLHRSHVIVINGPSYREWTHRKETESPDEE